MATDIANGKLAEATTPPTILPFLINCANDEQRDRVAAIIDAELGKAGISMEHLIELMASETLEDHPSFLALVVDAQASLAGTPNKGAIFKRRAGGLVEMETSLNQSSHRTVTIVGMKDGSVRVIFGGWGDKPQDLTYSPSGIAAPEHRAHAAKAINSWLTGNY